MMMLGYTGRAPPGPCEIVAQYARPLPVWLGSQSFNYLSKKKKKLFPVSSPTRPDRSTHPQPQSARPPRVSTAAVRRASGQLPPHRPPLPVLPCVAAPSPRRPRCSAPRLAAITVSCIFGGQSSVEPEC
ncbi:hypothetical protein VPH35_119670 [Triticum aestivum]